MCLGGDCLDLDDDLDQPCGCADCGDCVEPERTVVRRLSTMDKCEGLAIVLREISQVQVATCIAKLNSINVTGSTVTLITESNSQDQEYSSDGISFQDNNVFLNEKCGTRKYYVRQRSFPACISAKRASVTTLCDCESEMTPVIPPVIECIDNFLSVKYEDSCGNSEFRASLNPCGNCVPNLQDVLPLVPRCGVNNLIEYLQVDGCGGSEWRESNIPCGECVAPTVPFAATVTPATCNQLGQMLSNGSFVFGEVAGANKFGISLGSQYTGPDYNTAQTIPSNNIISVSGLQGFSYPTTYTLRIFNGSNGCFVDKYVNFPGVDCPQACIYPTATFYKADPTCNGSAGATNNNGILILSDLGNATRYQICDGSTFTCDPDYGNAQVVPGPGPFNIRTNVGFNQNEAFKDFVVRLYNGSEACYADKFLRFSNPCYNATNCQTPGNNAAVVTAATCSGATPNNNASIVINGITNANRYGFSVGTVYSGDTYANATAIGSNTVTLSALAGLSNSSSYVIRLYNGSNDCYKDISVTVPGVTCQVQCVLPTSSAGVGTPATCSGATPNNNASIVITSLVNVTKFGYSQGGTYTGPAFDSATTYPGTGDIQIANMNGSNSAQTFTVRLFNGSNTCFVDKVVTIAASGCVVSCVTPAFGSKSATPATCAGSLPNNDAIINISGITGMTKYGISNGGSYTGPTYAGATAASGSSLSITGQSGSTSNQTKTIRIFNGADNCFLDVTQIIGASSCAPSCVNPAFTLTSVPETCTDGASNGNGIVRISSITNGTKYQICLQSTFNCTPNYAGSPAISGSGPIDVFSAINTDGVTTSQPVTVRVYNGSESCFTDHTINIAKACGSCCNMVINSATLTNV